MSTRSFLREAFERRDETPAANRGSRGSRTEVLLTIAGPIDRGVSVARLLKSYRLTLQQAHAALERIVRSETVSVVLDAQDEARLVSEFADLVTAKVTGAPVATLNIRP